MNAVAGAPAKVSPLAGKPATPAMLVDVPRLVSAYYDHAKYLQAFGGRIPKGYWRLGVCGWYSQGMVTYHLANADAATRGRSLMRARLFVMLFAVTLCAYAQTQLLEHVPLRWKPTSEPRLGAMQMSQTPIQFETFQDVRDNKDAIGENLEDDKPKPVTTTDDVGAFVSSRMRELFDHAGLKTVDSNGTVTIKGEVREFFVRETTTYKSAVAVHLTVVSPDGRTLWSGLASGQATRFGRSYNLENYYGVLSDGIVNAVSSMLQSADFQKALSGR
jgi:hypothetical protein